MHPCLRIDTYPAEQNLDDQLAETILGVGVARGRERQVICIREICAEDHV